LRRVCWPTLEECYETFGSPGELGFLLQEC
jgi:hypothetical protein